MNKTVSIIIPHKWTRTLLGMDSIKAQTYPHIDIHIISDSIKRGNAATKNLAIDNIDLGEYVLFLDDDVILYQDCIATMVNALERNSEHSFAYCDFNFAGTREGIQRGQGWNYKNLQMSNYISTMALMRWTDIPEELEFDENLTRYIDWDWWLQLGKAGLKGVYIPEILFEAVFTDEGISFGGPLDRVINTEKLMRKHKITNRYCSIIVPMHNQLKFTKKCIESLVRYNAGNCEIMVIDDASTDPEVPAYLDSIEPFCKVIRMATRCHHTKLCNQGIRMASSENIILLNNDTLVTPDWNWGLISALEEHPDMSCVGPLTSHAASNQQIPGMNRLNPTIEDMPEIQQSVSEHYEHNIFPSKITGFCLATTKEKWNKIGEFNQDIPAGGNEAEWIIRAAAKFGWKPYIDTSVYVHHFGGQSYRIGEREYMWYDGEKEIVRIHGQEPLNWLEVDMYLKQGES